MDTEDTEEEQQALGHYQRQAERTGRRIIRTTIQHLAARRVTIEHNRRIIRM